jgi:hypothetical protein
MEQMDTSSMLTAVVEVPVRAGITPFIRRRRASGRTCHHMDEQATANEKSLVSCGCTSHTDEKRTQDHAK